MYSDTQLFIAGKWRGGSDGQSLPVVNPADEQEIGRVAVAARTDLDEAIDAAVRGFAVWRKISAFERSKILRKAADILRSRANDIGRIMTLEQGKPVPEASMEAMLGGDIIDWYAEEGRRTYGRVIPGRTPGVRQLVVKDPVGPVAAFTPWNFPINQSVRKLAGALAAGCSIVLKGPEETPASCAELVRAFADAGVPEGVINLVYGVPSEISSYLIPHPAIRKITFTGSTAVGKILAALAGQHMKRITMELGGHAPVVVMDDADVAGAVTALRSSKYRNAGQVCVSPTRFLIHDKVYDEFVSTFVDQVKTIRVGNGLDSVDMGPLANERRLQAMETLVADAASHGATVATGGRRIGNAGYFFEPTVLQNVPTEARIMNEEPFGPVIVANPISCIDAAIAESNRLPYGLAAYAYTRSSKNIDILSETFESGMVSVNQQGLALPETPFGGAKDSGYGSEGGSEALEPFLNTKFISQIGV